jgi:hypothetical protein
MTPSVPAPTTSAGSPSAPLLRRIRTRVSA